MDAAKLADNSGQIWPAAGKKRIYHLVTPFVKQAVGMLLTESEWSANSCNRLLSTQCAKCQQTIESLEYCPIIARSHRLF